MATQSITEKEFRDMLDKLSVLNCAEIILQNGLDIFNKDLATITNFKKIIEEYIILVKNRKIEYLYTLHCEIESGNKTYYDVGLFSTFDEAEKYIPKDGVIINGEQTIKITIKIYRNNGLISLTDIDKPISTDNFKNMFL